MVAKGKNPNSLANLKKSKGFNTERARAANRKSQVTKYRKKMLTELLKIALTLPNDETGEINGVAITNAIIDKAIGGDVSAYQTIRDTVGEKPTDKQETKLDIAPIEFNIFPVRGSDEL